MVTAIPSLMSIPINTIVIFPRPHPDNIVAIMLLRLFGKEKFPGVENAKIDFISKLPDGKNADDYEREGTLLIDMGGGKFDHHTQEGGKDNSGECATTLVAKYLGVDNDPALKKLLTYVKRDDLEGKGIISNDPIDRAFGFSGLIMNLNREYSNDPQKIIDITMPIFMSHYVEERKRMTVLPQQWEGLQKDNKTDQFEVFQGKKMLKVIVVENDDVSLVGFLRANPKTKADVVVQRLSSGHTNIITKQMRNVNLKDVATMLRIEEARKKDAVLEVSSIAELSKAHRLKGVEEWYYDTTANSIQNGGIAPEGITATKLSLDEVKEIIKNALNPNALADTCPKTKCSEENCNFYDYHLGRCMSIQKASTSNNK
jgi:hypothetical protein